MKTIAKIVGEKIRIKREALGISQKGLAGLAKISAISLNRYENGKQAPQGANLIAIATALQCKPEDLYGSEGELKFTDALDVLEAFENATPFRRAVVLAVLKQDASLVADFDKALVQFVRSLEGT